MMFTWMTPDGVDYNVEMNSEDDHTASSTLYISSLARSDNGTYKCYVINNDISDAIVVTSTTVIVEERPSQPLNFIVIYENITSLILSWSEPANIEGEIEYYIIYYSDGKISKTVDVFNFTGFYILNNLTPSTQYSVYVRAVRLIGITHKLLGSSSATASAKTLSTKTVQDDDDHPENSTIVIAILVVLFVVFLICCCGLIILVFKLYKKIVSLQEKIKFTDEKLKVPNPTYADLVVKPDDIDMENNPAYQCSSNSKQDDVKDHHYYETITNDDKVIKSVANQK